jgi:hypothetical protein
MLFLFLFLILFLLTSTINKLRLNIFKWLDSVKTIELGELHDNIIFYSMIILFTVV